MTAEEVYGIIIMTENSCYCSKEIKEIVIEDGVTRIGSFAFGYCKNLTSIQIPNSVTSIELGK